MPRFTHYNYDEDKPSPYKALSSDEAASKWADFQKRWRAGKVASPIARGGISKNKPNPENYLVRGVPSKSMPTMRSGGYVIGRGSPRMRKFRTNWADFQERWKAKHLASSPVLAGKTQSQLNKRGSIMTKKEIVKKAFKKKTINKEAFEKNALSFIFPSYLKRITDKYTKPNPPVLRTVTPPAYIAPTRKALNTLGTALAHRPGPIASLTTQPLGALLAAITRKK